VAFDSRPFPTRKRSTDIYERFSELENLFTDVYKTSPGKSASNDDEAYRKKLLHAAAKMRYMSIGNLNSPLKGTKVVVSNLAPSVNWEDMVELFSDIGNLKVVKMTEPGSAEVVFYNREDALKSVRVYHRRDLDGRPMQVSIREQSTESSFGNQTDNETNRLIDFCFVLQSLTNMGNLL
jgi:RNA recognition motif-containing protein